jgi:alpha-N-arabinofuranosidase
LSAATVAAVLLGLTPPAADAARDPERPPTLRIDARSAGGPLASGFVGANQRYAHNGYRTWNSRKNAPSARVVRNLRASGIETMRFPGGSVANMYDWKRAIGPARDRQCQVDARWGRNGSTGEYGIDEHMKLARMVNADTLITVPFAAGTPGDSADLVEYMNARVGEDPNGDGVDWARKRMRNQRRLGEPVGPYHVRRWSIGNEPYLKNQRYWMSASYQTALHQYLYGGRKRYEGQLVGRGCRRSEDVSQGTGRSGQRFRVLYPPVKAGSQTLTVDGVAWTEVNALTPRTARKNVYTLDDTSGRIAFGHGTDGRRPPNGAPIRASYTSVHKGFLAYSRAMHRADPTIDVCSEWGKASFVRRASSHRYDCLAAHSYSFLHNYRWRSARDGYDLQMVSEERRMEKLYALRRRLGQARGAPYLLVSEFGHLSNIPQPRFPQWEESVSDGVYMTTQFMRLALLKIPLAVGGALVARGDRGWLRGAPSFTLAAPTRYLMLLRPALNGRVVASRMRRTPTQEPVYAQGTYSTIVSMVTRDGRGRLNIVMVNKDPNDNVNVTVRNPYRSYRRTARMWKVVASGITDTSVRVRQRDRRLRSSQAFTVTVPKHSVVRLRLAPRRR